MSKTIATIASFVIVASAAFASEPATLQVSKKVGTYRRVAPNIYLKNAAAIDAKIRECSTEISFLLVGLAFPQPQLPPISLLIHDLRYISDTDYRVMYFSTLSDNVLTAQEELNRKMSNLLLLNQLRIFVDERLPFAIGP